MAMVLSGGYRRWHCPHKATNVPTTEELRANPTAYGHVGNGRMAIPVEDWLKLVEEFGPVNIGMYDAAGDRMDMDAQVAAVLEDQVRGCGHREVWYEKLMFLWFFGGWLPPLFALLQGWGGVWAWPVMGLWLVTSVVIIGLAFVGELDVCRRCGSEV